MPQHKREGGGGEVEYFVPLKGSYTRHGDMQKEFTAYVGLGTRLEVEVMW